MPQGFLALTAGVTAKMEDVVGQLHANNPSVCCISPCSCSHGDGRRAEDSAVTSCGDELSRWMRGEGPFVRAVGSPEGPHHRGFSFPSLLTEVSLALISAVKPRGLQSGLGFPKRTFQKSSKNQSLGFSTKRKCTHWTLKRGKLT